MMNGPEVHTNKDTDTHNDTDTHPSTQPPPSTHTHRAGGRGKERGREVESNLINLKR